MVKPSEFNLFDAIEEKVVATDSVIIYTDAQSLYNFELIEKQIDRIYDPEDPRLEGLNAALEEARTELEQSAHEVTIKPIPDSVRAQVVFDVRQDFGITDEEWDNEIVSSDRLELLSLEVDNAVMAKAIVSIKRVRDGAVQTDVTPHNVAVLRQLPPRVWAEVVKLYNTLTLEQAVYLGNAEDPNF